ncbi:MAG TPA: hypothetical protein VKB09_10865 [Thermomicrobiales bacterium]|nr:hypothetical protein [Thermomicrobiales bacterium]
MRARSTADPQTDRRLDLIHRYTQAVLQKKILPGNIPTDALTFLLPDDDAAYAEREIAIGVEIAKKGQDVYFRHIRVADLPE